MIKAPKGTKDILPLESYKWNFIETKARDVARAYNIKEIRTPIFEHTEVFSRSVGDITDIVQKEMYTFKDKSDRSITLRPEGTAGVARAYVENGLASLPHPIKVFYIGPNFRYEKPQKDRYRQHHQFGVEYFGPDNYLSEYEIISTAHSFLKKVGIKDFVFAINSLGNKGDISKYKKELRKYFLANKEHICKDCAYRVDNNVLRVLDCKIDKDKEVFKKAPDISYFLSKEAITRFNSLEKMLDNANINYVVDKKLVRGLDYYTGLVFEIFAKDDQGNTITLGGGGRYNNLISMLGGAKMPAAGFGIGMERVLITSSTDFNTDNQNLDIFFVDIRNEKETFKISNFIESFRNKGYSCELDLMGRSLKAQFSYANKKNAKMVVIIGDEEIKNNTVKIKDMSTGKENIVGINNAVDEINILNSN